MNKLFPLMGVLFLLGSNGVYGAATAVALPQAALQVQSKAISNKENCSAAANSPASRQFHERIEQCVMRYYDYANATFGKRLVNQKVLCAGDKKLRSHILSIGSACSLDNPTYSPVRRDGERAPCRYTYAYDRSMVRASSRFSGVYYIAYMRIDPDTNERTFDGWIKVKPTVCQYVAAQDGGSEELLPSRRRNPDLIRQNPTTGQREIAVEELNTRNEWQLVQWMPMTPEFEAEIAAWRAAQQQN